MQPISLLGHLAELYGLGLAARGGLDQVTQTFYSQRRYLGSRDRAWLSDQIWPLWRMRLAWEACTAAAPLPRIAPEWLAVLCAASKEDFPLAGWWKAMELSRNTWAETMVQRELASAEAAGEWLTWAHSSLPTLWAANGDAFTTEKTGWPGWLRDALKQRLASQCDADASSESICRHLEVFRQTAPVALRVNRLKADRAGILDELSTVGLDPVEGKLAPDAILLGRRARLTGLAAYRDGRIEVQDEGSQLIGLALDPRPGERILDACAGGGGKAMHLAALMQNQGVVYATDRNYARIEPLRLRSRRAGAGIIGIEPPDIAARLCNLDAVLVDAPCTGVGTIRRHPDLLWRVAPEAPEKYARTQLEILKRNGGAVKPGGRMVYATCSWLEAENDAVVERFLMEHPGWAATSPLDAWRAAAALRNWKLAESLTASPTRLGHQIWPALHGCDAFFVAVLRKTSP